MAEPPTTVTATGIARIAGVGRTAVSNWRRRYTDFPKPIAGTSASPAFDLAAVEQWLDGQGKLSQASPQDRVWQRVEAFGASGQLADAVCLIGALLLASPTEVPPSAQLAESLRSYGEPAAELLLPSIPAEWSPAQRALLEATVALAEGADPAEAFEQVHERYSSARGSSGLEVTPQPLANLMLELAGPAAQVFDFSCGTGSLLHAAYQRSLDSGTKVRISGQDVNPFAARIALLRLLLLRQHAADAGEAPDIRVGDPLLADAFPRLTASAVVANPPFGLQDWGHEQLAYDPRWAFGGLPPRTEPELAWVQHALAHLEPGGRAVVLMPPAAAARAAGRRIRGELVRRGALLAVIALPAGALPGTGISLHLWLLRRPGAEEGTGQRVLFMDVPGHSTPGGRTVDLPALRQDVLPLWHTYLASPQNFSEKPGIARSVPPIELLDEEIDLTPLRHLPSAEGSERNAEALLALPAAFDAQLESIRGALPQLTVAQDSALSAAPTATLDGLARTDALTLHRSLAKGTGRYEASAERQARPSTIEVKAVVSQDVIAGQGPSGTVVRNDSNDASSTIQAGDILIPAIASSVIARVATEQQIGAQLGMGVHAVRVNPDILDPWFAASVLSSADNTRRAGRSATGMGGPLRIDVKRLHLPVLPIEEQRRYGEALRRLADFEAELAHTAELGRKAARNLAEGLISGTLDPAEDGSVRSTGVTRDHGRST
ncbi:N-6 DNA methylase [Kitasatospora sp. NPDC001175]|uniref:N-6 DNA methylase n=1 Tax=Kitasatospora sp. NPDC001175 TaxID=3157103 RepID=UPI003CFD6E3D